MRVRAFSFLLIIVILSSCQASVIGEPTETDAAAFRRREVAIDPAHSSITFTGRSNIINHEGRFKRFEAALKLDPEGPTNLEKASVGVTIDLTSVETDTDRVTAHLQKEDFFDTANFPEASFHSTGIEHVSGNLYNITGDMTMKGLTEPMTMQATITDAGLEANIAVPRRAFGVGNDSYGNKLLEPMVPVEIRLVFQN